MSRTRDETARSSRLSSTSSLVDLRTAADSARISTDHPRASSLATVNSRNASGFICSGFPVGV